MKHTVGINPKNGYYRIGNCIYTEDALTAIGKEMMEKARVQKEKDACAGHQKLKPFNEEI